MHVLHILLQKIYFLIRHIHIFCRWISAIYSHFFIYTYICIYIFFSITYMVQGDTKVPQGCILSNLKIFFSGLMDSRGFRLVDSNSFLCTGNEGYVWATVYVTPMACLPILQKDPSSVVLSEVSAFTAWGQRFVFVLCFCFLHVWVDGY